MLWSVHGTGTEGGRVQAVIFGYEPFSSCVCRSMLCFQGTGAVVAWRHVVVFVPERDVVRAAFFVVLPEHWQRTGVARGIEGIAAKCQATSCCGQCTEQGQKEEGLKL